LKIFLIEDFCYEKKEEEEGGEWIRWTTQAIVIIKCGSTSSSSSGSIAINKNKVFVSFWV